MEINSRVVTLRKENSTRIAKPAQYCFLSRKNIEVGGFFFHIKRVLFSVTIAAPQPPKYFTIKSLS